MNALKKTMNLIRSRWYVRTGIYGAIGGCILLCLVSFVGELSPVHVTLTVREAARKDLMVLERDPIIEGTQGFHKLRNLVGLEYFIEHLPQYVLLPGFVVGWTGWSFDAGYKWLRKKRQQVES
jgi:hypothetical protein